MEPSTEQGTKKTVISIAVLLVIVLIVVGAVAFGKHGKASFSDTAATTTSTDSSSNNSTGANSNSSATYKDGTYNTTASYDSPAGSQDIGVSITLKDGVVTDSTVTSEATDGTAASYQSDFISGYKQFVTGKKINGISLSRVSGSSLTSNGFNSALQTIESKAQA